MRETVRVEGQQLRRGRTRNAPPFKLVLVRADSNSDGCDCTAPGAGVTHSESVKSAITISHPKKAM